MPLVRELLITLRTLMEDDPQPPRCRRQRHNSSGKNSRSKQTTALVLTFRDLFRPSGLNIILDEMEANRRSNRINRRNVSTSSNSTTRTSGDVPLLAVIPSSNTHDERLISLDQNITNTASSKLMYQDETTPLLSENSFSTTCTDIVLSPLPLYSNSLFSSFALVRRMKKKPRNVTVTLNPEDEKKTVATLRKVANWSPRKQNSTTFAVSLPVKEKHSALAVVENAVNLVKEEQLVGKKKKKFLWFKFC